jgi:hypothetical protein
MNMLWPKSISRLRSAALTMVVFAASAHAQVATDADQTMIRGRRGDPRVDRIEISLTSMACGLPSVVYVVFDDRDDIELPAVPDHGKWVWNADKPLKFDPAHAHASVRFSTARTDCKKPLRVVSEPGDANKLVAIFRFTTCIEPVQTVMITTHPKIDVSYVRDFTGDQADSVRCNEGAFARGGNTISALGFRAEKLLLQLGSDDHKVERGGLVLFSTESAPGLLAFSTSKAGALVVVHPAMKHANNIANGGVQLAREDLVDAFVKPDKMHLPGVSRDVYEKMIGDLTTVDVTVEKR